MKRDPVRDLGRWLWYLLPANPIMVRVVQGGGRRTRDLWYRFGYLLVLFLVFMFTFIGNPKGSGSLSELAKSSSQIFTFVAMTQLLLMCFLAPVFTAGAITQERDAETYNILLTTPLTNGQIILGSLLSRLFFVIILLFSGLPIFCITMIYGGVTLKHILLSAAIAGSTAIITGSLAIMISMIKIGTRRTIFSFFLFIGLYLLSFYFLGLASWTAVADAPLTVDGDRRMSWLTAFHPFLAMEVGLGRVPAPSFEDASHYTWPLHYWVAYPHVSYCVMTCLASVVMVVVSMAFVRRGSLEGEDTFLNRIRDRFRKQDTGEQRRAPRRVWSNPVAWREASTRASAGSGALLRYLLMAAGLLSCAAILWALVAQPMVMDRNGASAPFGPADARYYLYVLITIEFALILIVATNASATSMTKERESNTLDIMMTTPLSSGQIVWGKLRGLISYTAPMLAVPLVTLLIFKVYDLVMIGRGQPSIVHIETVVLLGALLLVYTAVGCVIGMQTSLKSKRTVQAVLIAISIMTAICGLSYLIGDEIVADVGHAGAALAPLTPFTAIKMMTDPTRYVLPFDDGGVRVMILVGVAIACVGWGGIVVFSLYKSLVKNFYMTLRKQTAS